MSSAAALLAVFIEGLFYKEHSKYPPKVKISGPASLNLEDIKVYMPEIDEWKESEEEIRRNESQYEIVVKPKPIEDDVEMSTPTAAKNEIKMTCKDVEIVRSGKQIVLPVGMAYDEGIEWLRRKREEDERDIGINYEFNYSPMDGAVAFHRALADIHGWAELVPTPGFFGPNPPVMKAVAVSLTEKTLVPWGRVMIPGVEGFLQTGIKSDPTPRFVINGRVKQKNKDQVAAIAEKTEELLRTRSIYRGQAVKISFAWEREGRDFDPSEHCPQFMPLDGVAEDDLIFGSEVTNALKIGLFAPIEYSTACRKYKVPLKRGVLLYGPYGVGKTLTATVTALKGVKAGFTFLYLDSVLDLKKGLQLAAQYAPAIVFAEDIDRVLEGERSLSMDQVLNIMDGCDTKGGEIITVFTTNHVENINPALLRMGRLDTLVEVKPPDEVAAVKLVKLYGRGLFTPNADFTEVGKVLAGRIPAFIREVTERAKIAAIYRLHGGNIEGQVKTEDLLGAAEAMKNHADMLEPKRNEVTLPTSHAHLAKELLNNLIPSVVVNEEDAAKNGKKAVSAR
ncbi:AAA family ATPase [Nitrospira sp. BLG_2]|uniref:AAA family ATPase n=1 Tax=Nitrospira sp. BLG_2 TaxID=3397507 RepID=UPI003B9A7131